MTVTCNTSGRGRHCGSMSVCSYSTNISCLWAVNWICIGCWFDSLITSLLHYVPLRLDHFRVWLLAHISVVQHQFAKSVVIGSHVTMFCSFSGLFYDDQMYWQCIKYDTKQFVLLKGSSICVYCIWGTFCSLSNDFANYFMPHFSFNGFVCVSRSSPTFWLLFFPINYIYTTITLTKPCVERQIKVCTHFEICCKLNLIGFT